MEVCISAIGNVGAWVLSSGRISYAAGAQGLFPEFFAGAHKKYSTPHTARLINAVLTTIVLMMNFVSALTDVYNFLLLLSTMSFLVFYAFGAASEIVLLSDLQQLMLDRKSHFIPHTHPWFVERGTCFHYH